MTIGIYKLVFSGTDSVYVGQSLCIENRYKAHISKLLDGSGYKKLQHAYNTYGVPTLVIIEVCSVSELDNLEIKWIQELDAINNGFNFSKGGSSGASGVYNSRAACSEDAYEEILTYLVETSLSTKEIASIVEVSDSVVRHISDLSRHQWLSEAFPEKYNKLVELRSIGTKRCAAAIGKVYPKIVSPDGIVYEVKNTTSFAKEHGLQSGGLCMVLNAKCSTHRGWHLESFVPEKFPDVLSPTGETFKIGYRQTKPFAQKHGLHPSDFAKLLRRQVKQCKGWTLA